MCDQSGLPSVLYDCPGLRDLILDDDNGFLIKHDPFLIADKIIEFYTDRESRSEKGLSAMDFVSNNFSMTKNVHKIISLYKGEN